MKTHSLQSCHLGPGLSPEQVITEHFFLYLLKGKMVAYNGDKEYHIKPGESCIACKNNFLRYAKHKEDGDFLKIVIVLDEAFLRSFTTRHPVNASTVANDDSFLFVDNSQLLNSFIKSLEPYYHGDADIDETFADIKREELLLILLRSDPRMATVLFNFGVPQKIDIKAFMNRNFRFNVSLDRFAFLTGRSLSSFKRDFRQEFNDTPGNWLTRKRLQEAYFLIQQQSQKPTDIYLQLGFEDLSHFSFAFKKQFGKSPSELLR